MAALAVICLIAVVVGVARAGPEAVVLVPGGVLAGAMASLITLGFTSAFNPLCQDGCSVGAAVFFIVAGVLISASFVTVGDTVSAEEIALNSGMGIGISAGAWIASLRAARRRMELQKAHAA